MRDESVDIALFSQALHHADDPVAALREAVRILVPGGRVLVLDLREHAEAWVRDRLGDRLLGFTRHRLASLLTDAGLDRRQDHRRGAQDRRPVHGADCSGRKPDQATPPSGDTHHAQDATT